PHPPPPPRMVPKPARTRTRTTSKGEMPTIGVGLFQAFTSAATGNTPALGESQRRAAPPLRCAHSPCKKGRPENTSADDKTSKSHHRASISRDRMRWHSHHRRAH